MEEEHLPLEPEAAPPDIIEPESPPSEAIVSSLAGGDGPPVDLGPQLEAERASSQALREHLAAAAVSYRAAVLALAPDVPPELVLGETPAEIDASLKVARGIVAAVRERIADGQAGAPTYVLRRDPRRLLCPPARLFGQSRTSRRLAPSRRSSTP
jgi:hypothetical protein